MVHLLSKCVLWVLIRMWGLAGRPRGARTVMAKKKKNLIFLLIEAGWVLLIRGSGGPFYPSFVLTFAFLIRSPVFCFEGGVGAPGLYSLIP